MPISHIIAIALVLIYAALWIGIIRIQIERLREQRYEEKLLIEDHKRQREAMKTYRLEFEEYLRRKGEQSSNN